jgi:hypothetical protein
LAPSPQKKTIKSTHKNSKNTKQNKTQKHFSWNREKDTRHFKEEFDVERYRPMNIWTS